MLKIIKIICQSSKTANLNLFGLSLPMKQAIIRLKNQNKPNRGMAKPQGVVDPSIWYIKKAKGLDHL